MRVAPANTGQFGAWDGGTGAYWAENGDRYDEGVAAYQNRFLDAAAISATDAVLDIGCGAGRTTLDAARHACAGTVLGVDLSACLLDLATERARREEVTNVTFRQADAQLDPFPEGPFDIVIGRHGSMFFGDPVAAFANVARALRPAGRLVLLTWQPFARQEWISAFFAALDAGLRWAPPPSGAPGPFGLSEPSQVREVLGSAGFVDVQSTGVEELMYYGPDPDDAFRFVAGQFTGLVDGLDTRAREAALDRLREVMAAHATAHGVQFASACWLVEATTTSPCDASRGS